MPTEVSGGTTLIEHWDGKQWTIVPSPDDVPDLRSTPTVYSITVISAHDIWMAGTLAHDWGQTRTALMKHWDGQKWTNVLDQSRVLENGTQAQESILWTTTNAGGHVLAGGAQMGSDGVSHAYLERWDGQNWQKSDVGSLGQNVSAIRALSGVSASDVWAIMEKTTSSNGQPVSSTFLAHWDGKTWKQVAAPGWLVGKNVNTWRILALSGKNVWVMNASPSALAHWDGKTWSKVRLPASDLKLDTFAIDFTMSAGATWVVGRRLGKEISSPLLEQQITCP